MKPAKRLLMLLATAVIAFSICCAPVFATEQQTTPSMEVVPGSPEDIARNGSSAAPQPDPEPPASQPAQSQPVSKPAASSQKPANSRKPVSSGQPLGGVSSASSSESSGPWGALGESALSSTSPSSKAVSLPSVGEVSVAGELIASGTEVTPESKLNWIGIVSWVCIALGVIVVIVVLFSTIRRPPRNGPGRKRYRSKPFRSKKKRLLNDKYYRNKY